MVAAMTKASQETAVGVGLAIGCIAIGVSAVTSSKMTIEYSFRHAWRRWPPVTSFPILQAGPQRDDIWRILRRSEGRRAAPAAWDNLGDRFEPYILHENWSPEDVAEVMDVPNVGLSNWIELAQLFVGQMKETEVTRSGQ